MQFSTKLSRIVPSATLAVNARAVDLKARGQEIINLSVGEPDFNTPSHICDAAKKAVDDGFTRYTPVAGIKELRQAVADYYSTFYGTTAAPECTMVSSGGKQVLYNLMQALLSPDEEVLIPAPYWVSYPDMVLLAGATPVAVETLVEDDFKVTPEKLTQALTPKTRMLLLNSPSNPTGMQYSADELQALAAWAVKHNIFVVADEIYDRLVYAPAVPVSLAKAWEAHPELFAIAGGLSKSFAMTGWRVGFVLAHPELIKKMCTIQSQSTSHVCSIAQKAALAALSGPMDFIQTMTTTFEKRRSLCLDTFAQIPGVVCPSPQGAFYVFCDVGALYNEKVPGSTALCTMLLEEAGLALVPGAAFGNDRCVRLSYALNDEDLARALDKLGKCLRSMA